MMEEDYHARRAFEDTIRAEKALQPEDDTNWIFQRHQKTGAYTLEYINRRWIYFRKGYQAAAQQLAQRSGSGNGRRNWDRRR